MPANEPATRRDVRSLRGDLEALEQRMDGRLRALEERMDLKLESLENRLTASFHRDLGTLRSELVAQTRTFVFATIGAVGTMGAVVIVAVRI